ncbi:fibroblast growth factor 19 [Ictalurus punctatus]|uniref:Fibroblast growth factor n=1 Tax=Ictalurus punctatus TaxID=7998 RepID=A0A2D0RRW3_ICTPU|nr:fibroblast growth factor 19 [Ictalurus punctatus]XP_053491630.1 fibroblast growth factor 19 [Ictalurus furcatus]
MLLGIFLCACCIGVALADSGPHLANDWGESVRLRHLYAARPGLHLQISKDGKIGGSHVQSSHSLVEIRTVDTGCVVIKGVASSQYLCMEANGKLYGSYIYIKDDCSFLEQVMADGYNIYVSGKHGTLVSLAGGKNRRQNALSQFLPLLNSLPQEPTEYNERKVHSAVDPEQDLHLGVQADSMESFGRISQIVIQSPSFNKR